MPSVRRKVLAGIGAIAAGIGGVWAFFNDPDESATQSGTRDDSNNSTVGVSSNDSARNTSATEKTQPNYPEAAHPDTTDPINESEAANRSEIAAQQPTSEDIEIDDTDITTISKRSATVTGTLTNTGEHTINTLELQVVFVNKSDREIGRAMWGTNDLGPDEDWDFEITGRGEKYSKAEDYTVYPEIVS